MLFTRRKIIRKALGINPITAQKEKYFCNLQKSLYICCHKMKQNTNIILISNYFTPVYSIMAFCLC